MEKKLIHEKIFDIHWGDMDAFGHMNNTVYFFYAQEARFAMLKEKNIKIDASSIGPVLAGADFKFKKPIFYPEIIKVETYLAQVQGKRVTFEHIIRSAANPDIIYAIGQALVVWYDFINQCSMLPPENVLDITYNKEVN